MSDDLKTERVEKALRELSAAFIDATVHAQDAFALVAYVKALESRIAVLERERDEAIAAEEKVQELHDRIAANGAEPVCYAVSIEVASAMAKERTMLDTCTKPGGAYDTPLYAAPVADSAMAKDARLDALKRAGSRMANTMFNMAQRSGEELDNQLCEKFAQMQKEWDAALRAIAASAEKTGE